MGERWPTTFTTNLSSTVAICRFDAGWRVQSRGLPTPAAESQYSIKRMIQEREKDQTIYALQRLPAEPCDSSDL